MTVLPRLRAAAAAAAVALCVSLALPAFGIAAATPLYTRETQQAYEAQLNKDEIAAAAVNHAIATVRLTLKNGSHYVFHYAAGGQKAAEAQLRSHGAAVTEIKSKKKKKHSKTLGSHPRRTIAIIVVVVVVIALAVFLLLRRRRLGRD